MDAIEALKTRRSVRKFKAAAVPKALLEEILDCGRLAASARNVQPWDFVVVTEQATRTRIAGLAEYGKFIAEAPACVVVLCKETKYLLEDGSAASQNILLAAHALGLGACWVAGDKKEYAEPIRRLLGAPEGHRLISMIAVGYPSEAPTVPGKRGLEEMVHWERF